MTLTFGEDMVTKNMCNPGCVLDICVKNEVDPTIGLGGVRPQTDRHTDRQRTYGYYNIDCNTKVSVREREGEREIERLGEGQCS